MSPALNDEEATIIRFSGCTFYTPGRAAVARPGDVGNVQVLPEVVQDSPRNFF